MKVFSNNCNLYFFTATNYKWKCLLTNDTCKQIIISSLDFLSNNKRVNVYSFVIMPNHIHLIWEILKPHSLANVQRDFMKFTAQQILFWLKDNEPNAVADLLVNTKDRNYQFWERNPLSVELYTPNVIFQKTNYIHNNPVSEKWKLADEPCKYKYSSALFYETGKSQFNFLKNITEIV